MTSSPTLLFLASTDFSNPAEIVVPAPLERTPRSASEPMP